MSESAVLEQPALASLRTPLSATGEFALPFADDGLRPDIGVTLVLVPLTVILCCAWGVRPNLDVQLYVLAIAALVLICIIPTFFLFMVASVLGLRGDAPGLTPQSTAGFLRNCAVLVGMAWIYTHLKAGVLLGTTYDALLRDCDRLLLGGADAWALCRALVPDAGAPLLSGVYILFLPLIVSCIFWLTLMGRTQAADGLTTSIVLGYYLGAFAYHILPAYGPAYLDPEAGPEGLSAAILFMQQLILDSTQAVQQDPRNAVIVPWQYIAAFPSLHLSHMLILTWYMSYHRVPLVLTATFSVLTALGTLYFGWHYLTDLVGGVAVAGLALWVTVPRRVSEATAEAATESDSSGGGQTRSICQVELTGG